MGVVMRAAVAAGVVAGVVTGVVASSAAGLLLSTLHAQEGEVLFYGPPAAVISAGVIIPPNRASIWISGTTPPVVKPDAPAGSPARFGDTRTQAAGVLKAIETQLVAQGLTLHDVVYIRAYLAPDKSKGGKIDVAGWNAAYTAVFGTIANPIKTARTTVGVAALVNDDFLIELEAFAVFPSAR